MNLLACFALGMGLGIILTEIKNWFLNRDLLDRATFRNPADYIYIQHVREEMKKNSDPFATFRKLLPISKKKEPELKGKIQEDMKTQFEKQALDEKTISDHAKQWEEHRLKQLRMGAM